MVKKNILLLYPDCPSSYGDPRNPPIGIGIIGTILQKKGFNVKIWDLRLDSYTLNKLKDFIDGFKPIFIGISTTSIGFKSTVEICKMVKNHFPHIVTIVGGPHPSSYPERTLKNKEIDFICMGEGESIIVEFAENIRESQKLKAISGIGYSKSGRMILTPKRDFIKDIDSLPFPDYKLYPLDSYRLKGGSLVLPLLTSRGCPYNCTFCCSYKIQGKKYRMRSSINVVDEIERNLVEYGSSEFLVVDDTFNLDKRRVIKICDEIKKRNLKIKWSCGQGIRADQSDYEIFRAMKGAGCNLVAIGIETVNPQTLKRIKKGESVDEISNSIKAAQKANLMVKGLFIIGLPGETIRDALNTVDFFKKTGIDLPRYSMMVIYPGTEMCEWMKENVSNYTDPYEYIINHTELENAGVQYETAEFSKEEKLRAWEIVNKEAEVWYMKKKLSKITGVFCAKLVYYVFKLDSVRKIARWAYQRKFVKLS